MWKKTRFSQYLPNKKHLCRQTLEKQMIKAKKYIEMIKNNVCYLFDVNQVFYLHLEKYVNLVTVVISIRFSGYF
jgi:hypothetical protein